jgi:hypothetical protein
MIGSRRTPFFVGSLITFVRLNSEIISNNLLLFSRNKSIFKSPFMIIFIIIDGFSDQILRKDRNCFGGGVLVYTSQDICVKPRYDLNVASGEIIWYEVIIPNFKILIMITSLLTLITSESMTISKLDTRIGSRRAPFLVGSLITFVRLNSEIIYNNLLLF